MASDSFTESSNTVLTSHTPDSGGVWTVEAAEFTIIATVDDLRHDSTTTRRAYKSDDLGVDTMKISANVKVATNVARVSGVCARMANSGSDFGNQYEAYLQFKTTTTQDVFLFKNVSGSRTQLGTQTVTFNDATYGLIVLTVTAGAQEVKFAGTVVITATEADSTLSGNRFAGLIMNGNSGAQIRLDDFLSEAIVASAPPGFPAVDGVMQSSGFVGAVYV